MAIRLNKTGEHVQYGTAIYTADTENDLQSLPNGNTPGSTCFCIATSKTYILNNQHEWVEKKTAGGGGESSGSSYPSADSRNFPLNNDNVTFTTQSKYYNDIAKAIQEKTGSSNQLKPTQMADAITNLPTPTYQQKSITPNFSSGNVDITADSDYDALSQVTVQKDSNLIAENIKKDVVVHGITGSYEGSPLPSNEDAIIDRSITNISNSSVTSIGQYAFSDCVELVSVDFPNVASIGQYAFNTCRKLMSVTFSKVTSIENNTFSKCENLTSASFPNVTSIEGSAFQLCYELTSIEFPKVTSIGNSAFSNCKGLTSANFPNVISIGGSAFSNCSGLTSIEFSNVTSIANSAFSQCSNLVSANLPKVTSIGNSAFFLCGRFNSLTLGSSTMCALGNANVFNNTSFASGKAGGTIYVPSELVATYQADAVWSQVLAQNPNNQILAIPSE